MNVTVMHDDTLTNWTDSNRIFVGNIVNSKFKNKYLRRVYYCVLSAKKIVFFIFLFVYKA